MFKTLLHYVAVKPFDFDEWDDTRKRAKALGFALAETEDQKRAKASIDVGTVFQLGPNAFDSEAEAPVKVGDVVAYVKNAGKYVKNPFTEDEVYLLNDTDLLMVLSKETEDV